jgi:hypothetical protein
MGEHSVATSLGRIIEIGETEIPTQTYCVIEFGGRDLCDCGQPPVDRPRPKGSQVVLKDKTHGPVHARKQIVELEMDNAGILAHGQRPCGHLCPQAFDELGTLKHCDRRPIGGETADFETVETGLRLIETSPKPIETLQLLVHMGRHLGWLRQLDLVVLIEKGGDTSTLANGNHRFACLYGETFRGPVTSTSLIGGDRSIRDEMDVGLQNVRPRIVEDDTSVHF